MLHCEVVTSFRFAMREMICCLPATDKCSIELHQLGIQLLLCRISCNPHLSPLLHFWLFAELQKIFVFFLFFLYFVNKLGTYYFLGVIKRNIFSKNSEK